MLLAIDVGNSKIGLAVYRGVGEAAERAGDWRVPSDRDRTADEYGVLVGQLLTGSGFPPAGIEHVAISSVVPALSRTLAAMTRRVFSTEPFFAGADTAAGLRIHYDPPSAVGSDRICSAVGAFARYGGPAIVVDCGTATTVNAIAANGDFLGGAIAPGLGTSLDALARQAAQLFRVELTAPPQAIGTSTITALQSGLIFGYAGLVDTLVERFRKEMGAAQAHVIATGGLAETVRQASRTIEISDPWLALDGLRLLFERNLPPPSR